MFRGGPRPFRKVFLRERLPVSVSVIPFAGTRRPNLEHAFPKSTLPLCTSFVLLEPQGRRWGD